MNELVFLKVLFKGESGSANVAAKLFERLVKVLMSSQRLLCGVNFTAARFFAEEGRNFGFPFCELSHILFRRALV